MTSLLEQAKLAGEIEDHSEATVTSGGQIPAEGRCPVRFVGYVDLGLQPQKPHQGQDRDPCEKVKLTFECFGPKNVHDIEKDGKTVQGGRILSFDLKKSTNSKATFYKMFKSMAAGRDIKHMAEMLDEVFLATVFHSEYKGADGKDRKNASFRNIAEQEFDVAIKPPVVIQVDPDTGEEKDPITVKAPAATIDHQLFISSNPTVEQWDSIYIEGTYKNKAGEEQSKNFIQETIENSLDWEGSPMQLLLAGLLDEDLEEVEEVEEEEPVEVKEKPKATKKKATKKSTKDDAKAQADAELAALGLA